MAGTIQKTVPEPWYGWYIAALENEVRGKLDAIVAQNYTTKYIIDYVYVNYLGRESKYGEYVGEIAPDTPPTPQAQGSGYSFKPLQSSDVIMRTIFSGSDIVMPGNVETLISASLAVEAHSWGITISPDHDLGYYYSIYSGTVSGDKICDVFYIDNTNSNDEYDANYAKWKFIKNIVESTEATAIEDTWNELFESAGNIRCTLGTSPDRQSSSDIDKALVFVFDSSLIGDRIRDDVDAIKLVFRASGTSNDLLCKYYVHSDAWTDYGPAGYEEHSGFWGSGAYCGAAAKAYRDIGIMLLHPTMYEAWAHEVAGTNFGQPSGGDYSGTYNMTTLASSSSDMVAFLGGTFTSGSDGLGLHSISLKNEIHYKENIYFCRVFNKEFNYTANDTSLTTNEAGEKTYIDYLRENPLTMITTIGLYDINFNLVAVAKPDRPIFKDFGEELVMKVKLRY